MRHRPTSVKLDAYSHMRRRCAASRNTFRKRVNSKRLANESAVATWQTQVRFDASIVFASVPKIALD
jgi:hypothetical protein